MDYNIINSSIFLHSHKSRKISAALIKPWDMSGLPPQSVSIRVSFYWTHPVMWIISLSADDVLFISELQKSVPVLLNLLSWRLKGWVTFKYLYINKQFVTFTQSLFSQHIFSDIFRLWIMSIIVCLTLSLSWKVKSFLGFCWVQLNLTK